MQQKEQESTRLMSQQTEEVESQEQKQEEVVNWTKSILNFIFPAIGGMLFGYDIGSTSGVLLNIHSSELSGVPWYNLSSFQEGAIVSLSLLGALTGSVIALFQGNKLGRKYELVIASFLYGIGALLSSTSGVFPQLCVGRIVYGIGIGLAMHGAPAYIAETSPNSIRGTLISLKEALIVVGILLGYLGGYELQGTYGGWKYMYALSIPLAAVLGVGMMSLPDSPRWQLLEGKPQNEARQSLQTLRGDKIPIEQVESEFQLISQSANDNRRQGEKGLLQDLKAFSQKRYYLPLGVGLSLTVFQQITGQPSVLYYAGKLFQQAGFADASQASGISVILGVFKLLTTLIAVGGIDKLGRRPLLLYGVSTMAVSLIALGIFQGQIGEGTEVGSSSAIFALIAMLCYVGAYQGSFGPITWLVVGEVFPLGVRNAAIAICTFTNFISNFVVSLSLPYVQSSLGISNTYYMFSVISMIAVATIYVIVPETKGKSLEEIEKVFQGKEDSD